jgi:hypothetical protein
MKMNKYFSENWNLIKPELYMNIIIKFLLYMQLHDIF